MTSQGNAGYGYKPSIPQSTRFPARSSRPNYQSYDQSYNNYNQRPRGQPNQIVNYDQEVSYMLTGLEHKINTNLIKVINVYEAPQNQAPSSKSNSTSSSNAVQIFSVIGMICFLVAILGFVIIMKHKRRQSGDTTNSDEK